MQSHTGDSSTSSGAWEIQKESRQPQFAATSLLQLSQVAINNTSEEDRIVVDSDSVIEIPGQKEVYIIVNLENNEQQLLPISQLSNFINSEPNQGNS